MSRIHVEAIINGEPAAPVHGRYADLIDPCTGEVFASAPVSSAEDVDAAMAAAAAAAAFETWRETTPSERQRALLKIADAVEAHADELVALESRNTGKPLGLTSSEELPPAIDQLRFFAGAARVLEGRAAAEYLAARAGGAPVAKGALRVTFWGALAMALTAGVGSLFGTAG